MIPLLSICPRKRAERGQRLQASPDSPEPWGWAPGVSIAGGQLIRIQDSGFSNLYLLQENIQVLVPGPP